MDQDDHNLAFKNMLHFTRSAVINAKDDFELKI